MSREGCNVSIGLGSLVYGLVHVSSRHPAQLGTLFPCDIISFNVTAVGMWSAVQQVITLGSEKL